MTDEKLLQIAEDMARRSRQMVINIMSENGMTEEEIEYVFDNLPKVKIYVPGFIEC